MEQICLRKFLSGIILVVNTYPGYGIIIFCCNDLFQARLSTIFEMSQMNIQNILEYDVVSTSELK